MITRNLPKILKLLIILTGCFGLPVQAESLRYPFVVTSQGQAWISGKDNKKQMAKAKTRLTERAVIETSATSSVQIQLDADRSFTVLENSEVLLPTISWEGGEAPVLILKKGLIRWQQLGDEKPSYNCALHSDLFEFLAPKGDFLFTMDPERAYAGVKVIKGIIEFFALNAEESATVQSGQEVGFQGILEGKEIAYDVLLKGKKIPRGHLTPVVSMTAKELAAFQDEVKNRKKLQAAQKAQQKRAQEDQRKSGSICSNPSAKFNQCAWVCLNNPKSEKKSCLVEKEGVSCVRRRCNANGEWAEEMDVDAQKSSIECKLQPVVAPCDY